MKVRIAALFAYPVKSLAGIALPEMTLRTTGPAADREWLIADREGRFVTQRQLPKLASIRTELVHGRLQLSTASGQTLLVPEPEPLSSVEVRVWGERCLGFCVDDEVNRWLTRQAAADETLRLIRFDPSRPRPLKAERFGDGNTHFADAAPYLVTSSASLQALNAGLAGTGHPQLEMLRFRPNIVLEGLPPFAEHDPVTLANEACQLQLVDHCQRCSVVTVNPSTGSRDADAQLLVDIARVNAMPGRPKAPAFGVNTLLRKGDGAVLRVGDYLWVQTPHRQAH